MSELKVLLVGKRGIGKSTVGNSLLGKRVFETKFSDQSVTTKFKSESRIWRGRKILIIDGPELLPSNDFKSDLQEHAPQGPHAFLLVTPLGSLTEKSEELLKTIQERFEDQLARYMIVLLTRKEDLEDQNVDTFLTRKEDLEDQNVDTFLTRNADLHKLVKTCGNRYSISNYRATEKEEQCQVDELLQKIVKMVQYNGDKPCNFKKQETLHIVLVGRSGTGKSATGNSILGSSVFASELRSQPLTRTWQKSRRLGAEQDVVVVDTADFCLMASQPQLLREVEDYVDSHKGNTVLVLVLQLGRLTAQDREAVRTLRSAFGKDVMGRMLVLFTRKEDLAGEDIGDYCGSTDNVFIKEIVRQCGSRVCAFNNKETGRAMEDQVAHLLKMANELVRQRSGRGYSRGPADGESGSRITGVAQERQYPGMEIVKKVKNYFS